MHTLLPFLALVPLALPSVQDAQDTAPTEAAPEAWEIALEALQGLRKEPIAFTGSVEREKPGRDNGANFFISSMAMGGMPAKPYVGGFEGFRYGDEEICLVSEKRYPGFAAWSGEELIIETLSGKESHDVVGVVETVGRLLDASSLARQADEAEWSAKAIEGGKGWTLTAVLPADLLDADEPEAEEMDVMGFGMMAVSIGGADDNALRVETELKVDASGKLTHATFAVVHNDSNAAMQKAFEEQEEGMFDMTALDDLDPIDGEVVTWSLTFGAEKPAKRVEAFRSLALDILETEGR